MRKGRDCPIQAKVSKLARIMIVDTTCHQLSSTFSWAYFFVAWNNCLASRIFGVLSSQWISVMEYTTGRGIFSDCNCSKKIHCKHLVLRTVCVPRAARRDDASSRKTPNATMPIIACYQSQLASQNGSNLPSGGGHHPILLDEKDILA